MNAVGARLMTNTAEYMVRLDSQVVVSSDMSSVINRLYEHTTTSYITHDGRCPHAIKCL